MKKKIEVMCFDLPSEFEDFVNNSDIEVIQMNANYMYRQIYDASNFGATVIYYDNRKPEDKKEVNYPADAL